MWHFTLVCSWALFVFLPTGAFFPKLSDVSFTSREWHNDKIGNSNTFPLLNTTSAGSAFLATRLDWLYTDSAADVEEAARNGYPATVAMNGEIPDPPSSSSSSSKEGATYDIGRVRNLYGKKLTAPWMRAWSVQPYWGCINNPDYLEIAFAQGRRLADLNGTAGIQHDDPGCNYEAVQWKDGGCYCSHCIAKFSVYARENGIVPPEYRNESFFNYSAYLISKGGYGKGSDVVRLAFEAFQMKSTQEYVRALRKNITYRAGPNHPPQPIVLSCNNGVKLWNNITREFDMGIGELAHADCTPDHLHDYFLTKSSGGLLPEGKKQIVTMPKTPAINTMDKVLIRKGIGLSYALGGLMMVPWDIYLPTPNALRFYGNVSDYVDLFRAVRIHSATIESHSALRHTWKAGKHVMSAVGNKQSSAIYWTIRSTEEKDRNSSSSSLLIHLVDYHWLSTTSIDKPSGPIEYPLPSNKGTTVNVTLRTDGWIRSSSFTNASVYWLTADAQAPKKELQASVDAQSIRFIVPQESVKPWAMVRIVLH